jgi:hypothetical protein
MRDCLTVGRVMFCFPQCCGTGATKHPSDRAGINIPALGCEFYKERLL